MAYEHDHITGNRPGFNDQYNVQPAGGARSGVILAIGAVVLALIVAVFAFSGQEGAAPGADPAAAPAAIEGAPAADPAAEPSGAIPGVDPMVPAEPAPAGQ